MTTMTEDQRLELSWNAVGALPIVSHFLDRLGLEALLARYLPAGDVRALMASWRVIRALLINLCLEREPLYGIAEWATRHDAGALGLEPALDLQGAPLELAQPRLQLPLGA